MHGDQIVGPEEEVQVRGVQVVGILGLVVHANAADDGEQVAIVLLDLDATVRVQGVLDGQRVKPEHLFQQRVLVTVGAIDVYP